jgi:hypothetical protein
VTTSDATPPAPPPPSTPFLVQQNDPAVAYSGGTWSLNTTAAHSGGSAVLSMDPNARATVTFTGTGVNWLAYCDEWSGIAHVYVDGLLKATIDTYSTPSKAQAVMYTISALTAGTHTLAIEVTGQRNASSGGTWVWVDAFTVTP